LAICEVPIFFLFLKNAQTKNENEGPVRFTRTVKTIKSTHFCKKTRINLQNRLESIWYSQINPLLMIVYAVYPKSKPVSRVNQLKCVHFGLPKQEGIVNRAKFIL